MEEGFPEIKEAVESDSYIKSLITTAVHSLLPQISEDDNIYEGHWMCGVCTFANEEEDNACAICEAPRVT